MPSLSSVKFALAAALLAASAPLNTSFAQEEPITISSWAQQASATFADQLRKNARSIGDQTGAGGYVAWVSPDGTVQSVARVSPAGSVRLDASAQRAIREIGQFAALPGAQSRAVVFIAHFGIANTSSETLSPQRREQIVADAMAHLRAKGINTAGVVVADSAT
jgi:hypothetical protein